MYTSPCLSLTHSKPSRFSIGSSFILSLISSSNVPFSFGSSMKSTEMSLRRLSSGEMHKRKAPSTYVSLTAPSPTKDEAPLMV